MEKKFRTILSYFPVKIGPDAGMSLNSCMITTVVFIAV